MTEQAELSQLADRVAQASKAAGLSQTQLAQAASVSRGFVQNLMRGARFDDRPFEPKPISVLSVVEALNGALASRGVQEHQIKPDEALLLIGVDRGELDRYLAVPTGRPNTTPARIAELSTQLTNRQREAVVSIVESMIYPTSQDELAAADEMPVHYVAHEERPRGVPGPVVEHVAHEEPARD